VIGDATQVLATWAIYAAVLAAALYVVAWPLRRLAARRRGGGARARGWAPWLVWLAVVLALVALAPPLYRGLERRARIAKARGDVRTLGKALAAYAAHCDGPPPIEATGSDCRVASGPQVGAVPAALLEPQHNRRGVLAGPFLEFIPRLPQGWSGFAGAYEYVVDADRRVRVCAAGDGVVADSRASGACP